MILRNKIVFVLALLFFAQSVYAAFPQNFEGVVFVEDNAEVASWPATADLNVNIGATLTLDHSKKNSWPISSRLGGCCIASAWGFVEIQGVWHAGTFEYLRPGQITKDVAAFGGEGHFRSPIGSFTPQVGVVYGFMVSGVARDDLSENNVKERSNVVLWRWGVGEEPYDPAGGGPEPETPIIIPPIIDLLLE